MRDNLPTFVRHLESENRARRTVRSYEAILASFVATSAPAPGRAVVERFLARPRPSGRPASASTRNQELAALRKFARLAVREGWWSNDPTAGIPFVREPRRDPAVLSVPEMQQLLSVTALASRCEERARNLALVAVLATCGLRVHELEALNLEQLDVEASAFLNVRRKGGAALHAPLNAPALILVRAWAAERPTKPGEAALFLSRAGSRLSVRSIQRLLVTLRREMKTAKRLTPHALRHSVATNVLRLGGGLHAAADLLGHVDVNTTRKYYAHLVDAPRRDAVERLAVVVPPHLLPSATRANDPPADAVARPQEELDVQNPLDDAA